MLSRLRLPTFVAIWCAGVLACVAFGGVLNLLNDAIGPIGIYRYSNSSYNLLDGIASPAITQGMQEGFYFGVAMAFVITLYAFWVTCAQCLFIFGIKHVARALYFTFVFWLVGGINALLVFYLFPYFVQEHVFRNFMVAMPGKASDAWNIGSLWGAYIGSVPATLFACYKLQKNWQAQNRSTAEFDRTQASCSTVLHT